MSADATIGCYRIKTVARLTGIAPGTIRAWERRYGVVVPSRSAGGQRTYTDRDVAKLHRVKAMLDTGLSIGEACDVLRSASEAVQIQSVPESEPEAFVEVRNMLAEAFVSLNREKAERILRPLLPLYSFEVTFEEIFAPTLVRLGELWQAGDASVAAEHFGAAFVREKLIAMLSAVSATGQGRPRALLACLEGERHELGLLYLALRLCARGWETVYLGADMPSEGLIEAIDHLKPGIVGLSLARVDEEAMARIKKICERAAVSQVLVGGAALASSWRQRLTEVGATVVLTDEDLNVVLRQLRRGRAPTSPAA